MPQLVNSLCSVCGERITSVLEAEFCKTCNHPVHLKCVDDTRSVPEKEGVCRDCGSDLSEPIGPPVPPRPVEPGTPSFRRKSRLLLPLVLLLLTAGVLWWCLGRWNRIQLTCHLYPESHLTVPIDQTRTAFISIDTEKRKIWAIRLGDRCRFNLPEWCRSRDLETLRQNLPDIRLTVDVDGDGSSILKSSGFVMKASPANTGEIFQSVTEGTVMVLSHGRDEYFIVPQWKYSIVGDIEDTSTTKDEETGEKWQVVYVVVSSLESTDKLK